VLPWERFQVFMSELRVTVTFTFDASSVAPVERDHALSEAKSSMGVFSAGHATLFCEARVLLLSIEYMAPQPLKPPLPPESATAPKPVFPM